MSFGVVCFYILLYFGLTSLLLINNNDDHNNHNTKRLLTIHFGRYSTYYIFIHQSWAMYSL